VNQLESLSPNNFELIGAVYQFSLFAGEVQVHKFSNKLILEFKYDPQQVDNPDKLSVHWFNPETENWDKLPSIVDVNTNTVTTLIDHWSKFALMETLPENTINPWLYLFAGVLLISTILISVWIFKRRVNPM